MAFVFDGGVCNYQAQIIGHGTEEDGVRKLNKKTGKTIAEELKQLTSTIHDTQAQLTCGIPEVLGFSNPHASVVSS
jgi:hypothetical protein